MGGRFGPPPPAGRGLTRVGQSNLSSGFGGLLPIPVLCKLVSMQIDNLAVTITSGRPDKTLVTRTVLRLNAGSHLPRVPFVRLNLMRKKIKHWFGRFTCEGEVSKILGAQRSINTRLVYPKRGFMSIANCSVLAYRLRLSCFFLHWLA